MKETRKIKVIGAGGIGCCLIDNLARYLSCSDANCEITIVDGDKYEERNRERQRFTACENKAENTVARLKEEFPKIHFRAKPEYITSDNVITTIREGDTVMLCVDNHATRKLVSERCSELDDVTLISGGNDYSDGNAIVYQRQRGTDLTKSPVQLHPKIANPQDKNPGDLTDADRQGCQELAQQAPQLLFANLGVAFAMLCCYRKCEQGPVKFNQVYVDVDTLRMKPAPDDCF